eukprot:jgi/Botrbrau1/10358/Bobra.0321s0033.1
MALSYTCAWSEREGDVRKGGEECHLGGGWENGEEDCRPNKHIWEVWRRVHGKVSRSPAKWEKIPHVLGHELQEVKYEKASDEGIAKVRFQIVQYSRRIHHLNLKQALSSSKDIHLCAQLTKFLHISLPASLSDMLSSFL